MSKRSGLTRGTTSADGTVQQSEGSFKSLVINDLAEIKKIKNQVFSGSAIFGYSLEISKIRSNKLSTSIKDILKRAILYQGTTIINFSYDQNKKGNFSDELQIFGKTNSPCPKCSKPIIKIYVAQRGTHYCKQCQKY